MPSFPWQILSIFNINKHIISVQHRQKIGGDICLTTLEKKETFDLEVRNWGPVFSTAKK